MPEVLKEGQAVPVNTGGVLPRGTVAVIPHEKVVVEGQYLRVLGNIKPGDNIKRAGEDFARNDILLTAGTQIEPAALGLLAALGIGEVEVFQKPRIAIICLADNIVPPGLEPDRGQMRDSNGPMLSRFISRQGGVVTSVHYRSVTGTSMKNVLEDLCSQTQMIILVGELTRTGKHQQIINGGCRSPGPLLGCTHSTRQPCWSRETGQHFDSIPVRQSGSLCGALPSLRCAGNKKHAGITLEISPGCCQVQ